MTQSLWKSSLPDPVTLKVRSAWPRQEQEWPARPSALIHFFIFNALAPRPIQSSSWNFCILHDCLSPHRVIKREPFQWPTLVTWSLHRPLIDQSIRGPNLVHPQNSLCVNAFNSDPSKLTPTHKYIIFLVPMLLSAHAKSFSVSWRWDFLCC